MSHMTVSEFQTRRSRAIEAAARVEGPYTFNPSVRSIGDDTVVAVRWSESPVGPVKASSIVLDGKSLEVRKGSRVDLTGIGAKHGIAPVADPKLFSYAGGVWATFNTGFVREGNAVYVMQVHPRVGSPIRCEAPQRQRIEKNWGFFEGPDGDLRAIYQLDPLTVLSFGRVHAEGGGGTISGEAVSVTPNAACRGMTIGTQPVVSDGELLLIGHQRVGVKKWRGYFGRVVRLRLGSEAADVMVSTTRLLHDWRTIFGSRPRRNKHLWFATYFSGIDVVDGRATISYGVNDQRACAIEVLVDSL